MVFFIDEARSRPPPRLLTNVNKKMVFFIEGFPNPKSIILLGQKAKNLVQKRNK